MSYPTADGRILRSESGRLLRFVPWAAGLLVAVVLPRLLWAQYLDPFEDGYQNWWIARYLVETGTYWDPFSSMTQGNWLPGYHVFLAGLSLVVGNHAMPVFKLVNILLALATTGVVYLLARPGGQPVALVAAFLFALNPADIVITTFATPEALTLLSVFAGVLVLERRPWTHGASLVVASALFLLGVTLRYEAWLFLLIYLAWSWRGRRLSLGAVLAVSLPAAMFLGGWLLWTSQFGFLPQTIIGQTSADVRYKESIGALAPGLERLWTFSVWYLGWTPLALAALLWGFARERRSAFTAILVLFYGAIFTYTLLDFGNPSARYVHLTIPIVCLFTARGVVALGTWLRRQPWRHATWASLTPAFGAIGISLLLTVLVIAPSPTPGTLTRPMERAGLYLQGLPLPAGKVLVSESPIAAYLSGYPASRILGSTQLPDDPLAAEAFLVEHAAYVVMVTVPYYQMRTLFPTLADGVNTDHLILLFDASGPEYALGAHRVLVYEVVP